MTSTMTEKTFREAMLNVARSCGDQAFVDGAVQVMREAGLEFAPEPVRLPATFALKREPNPGGLRLVDTGVNAELSIKQGEEVCRRAMLYPGLEGRARAFVKLITPSVTFANGDINQLRDALSDLRDALAKGQK